MRAALFALKIAKLHIYNHMRTWYKSLSNTPHVGILSGNNGMFKLNRHNP